MCYKLCDYGCEQEAKYQFKNGKWCCSINYQMCPFHRNKRKKFKHTQITKEKISNKNIGRASKNKGKSLEEIYGIEKAKQIKEKNKNSHIGKTWEKLYGNKKASLMKKKAKERINKNFDNFHWSKLESKQTTIKKIKTHHINVMGENNPNWKGGYHSRNIPTYNFFYNKLTIEEDPKRDINDKNILTVKCSYCKNRFIPKLSDIYERVRALNGKNFGEQKLYCSNECKEKCTVFNKHSYQNNHPKHTELIYTNEEIQEFRKFVFSRDGGNCVYCDNKAEHVHHERPQKLEPFYALDPDFAWSVCKKCHENIFHKKGTKCSRFNISKIICH